MGEDHVAGRGATPKPAREDRRQHSASRPRSQPAAEAGKTLILDPAAPYTSAAVYLERRCKHEDGPTLRRHRGAFYEWTGAHYVELGAEDARAAAYRFLDSARAWRRMKGADKPTLEPFKPTSRQVSDLVDALRARVILPDTVAMPSWLDGKAGRGAVIPMANGLLDLDSGELLPHSPAYFQGYSLPFDYDPGAPEPEAWLRFLRGLWPDDPDAIGTLQEMLGLLLTDDTTHHKLFMLVGPPRSGKGTIARVIQGLLGKGNVAGPTLSGLASNFGLQELIGKPVAIISDARLGGRSDNAVIVERLLSISGEDQITIDRKHRDPWTGTLPTRFVILSNELPRLADASGALATRFVILMLTKSFLGKEDHGLTGTMLGELSGIFNWALEGRADLADRGRFVMPKSSQAAVERVTALGSPILAFISEQCVVAPAASVECKPLYEAWRAWCQQQGRDRPGTIQTFGNDLHSAVPGLSVFRPRDDDGKQARHYQGIRLRLDDEEMDDGRLL